jgi:phospholipase C
MYGKDPSDLERKFLAGMTGFAHSAQTGVLKYQSFNLTNIEQVMSSFHPSKIPIHKTLAENFVVCDKWFSSVPGPTTPNRAFIHAATSGGLISNRPIDLAAGIPQRTILSDLDDENIPWKNYYEQIPGLFLHRSIRVEMMTKSSKGLDGFFNDLEKGTLANYSHIEPFYGLLYADVDNVDDGHSQVYYE